jgi:hypothetical protein
MLALLCGPPSTVLGADEPLARARQLYNERRFELAVQAADEARTPEKMDSADLIAGRALLQKFRESRADTDLGGARERLRRLNPGRLSPTEQIEYLVGLGQHLYYEGTAGAAANVFDNVLLTAPALSSAARERVLDWWGNALDRDARPRAELDRHPMYQRIRDRMRDELAMSPASAVAPYWLAAAASGQGDHQAAWDAALAGWVRSPMNEDRGASLRAELDALVRRSIVPQRARALALPPETLLQEWDDFTVRWGR